jgi:hypothetical protein
MRIFQRGGLCAALVCCSLIPADTEAIAWQPSVETEPTFAGAQTDALPNRPATVEFLVRHKGCWLLGADGEEKEYLSPPSLVAISPDGSSIARGEYLSSPRPDERRGWLVIQSRKQPQARDVVPLISGMNWSPIH